MSVRAFFDYLCVHSVNILYSDTGDLGKINPATGDIIITGRAKDTIVLSNGENVEPQPIEDAIVGTSLLVDQAILLGQDQNYLSAFLVVNPAELARRGKQLLLEEAFYILSGHILFLSYPFLLFFF